MPASSKKRAMSCARNHSRPAGRNRNTASRRSEKRPCCATSRISRRSSRPHGAHRTMHAAIIMDGNGRWATQRGLPCEPGRIEGAKAVRTTVEAAARANVEILTLYAFPSANWTRPPAEIAALMRLFGQYLFTETRRCVEESIRINVIGRRDRLSENLLRSIEQSERSSAAGSGMLLRIAVDYSSQHSILEATRRAERDKDPTPENFQRLLNEVDHCAYPVGEVDLLIRTGS